MKGREESSLNAKLELCCLREWLSRIRGEVDAGLVRVDAVLKVLESDGPGQKRKASGWISKPMRKNRYKGKKPLVHKVGVGSGLGTLVAKVILQPKSHMSAGARTSSSMGLVEETIPSPGECEGPDAVKESMQANPHTHADAGFGVDLGLAEGLGSSPGMTGLVGKDLGFSKTGEDMHQRSGNIEIPSELQSDQETDGGTEVSQVEGERGGGRSQRTHSDGAQRAPMGRTDSSGSPRKNGATPARGVGANLDVKGMLNQPNNSWVVGRTGFGPLITGKDGFSHTNHACCGGNGSDSFDGLCASR